MKEFTTQNLKDVRKDLDAVLEVAAEQLGISLSLGTISFSSGKFHVKLTGISQDSSGNSITPLEKDFIDWKKFQTNGEKDILNIGDTFTSNGETFTIVGFKPRSRKYPLIGENENGKRYKFSKKLAYKPGKIPSWL